MKTRLRELREASGMTQESVASVIGRTKQAVSLYEIGTREPNVQNLIKLADLFHVTIDYLVKRSDENNVSFT
ncbi:helix-turn-helix domain-containing protein [Levilactobacillus humaensis]|uniref:helix-turn-helix domain-containing protein n=1 Tax=Levilactobacillus humaensis TaxID=2950375 RepID=UPI0035A2263E